MSNKCYERYLDGFKSLLEAVTILRENLSFESGLKNIEKINSILIKHNKTSNDLNNFFLKIDEIVTFIDFFHRNKASFPFSPIVFVIEGLDGSGKSMLARSLAKLFSIEKKAYSTPTEDFSSMRVVFDSLNSKLSRAFYMISNYALMKIMIEDCNISNTNLIYIVDRWYSSTCAYTISKNTIGNVEEINRLDLALFEWPEDLIRPGIVFILNVSHLNLKSRINSRLESIKSKNYDQLTHSENQILQNSNPWDDLIQSDINLSSRIMKSLDRINVNNCLVDGNECADLVLESVSYEIKTHLIATTIQSNTITVAFCGPHTSGKKTIGKLLAKHLNWEYQEELGDILRNKDNLTINGHLIGDGSSTIPNFKSWDEMIFDKEQQRDSETNVNRVVETWHIGNLLWATLRSAEAYKELLNKTKLLINKDIKRGKTVILICLDITAVTMIRRRQLFRCEVLPLQDESKGCDELCDALGTRAKRLLKENVLWSETEKAYYNIIDNNIDQDENIVLRQCIDFIYKNILDNN